MKNMFCCEFRIFGMGGFRNKKLLYKLSVVFHTENVKPHHILAHLVFAMVQNPPPKNQKS